MLTIPSNLNFGSGKSFKEDFLNIDILPERKPDLLFDLNNPFPFDQPLKMNRFDGQSISRGHFDYILADNVLEHIQNLITAMTSCLELLKVGGILEIDVPYDLSYGAWQDPTHVRAFNERSWYYYTDWCWYVGWTEYRFDLISQVYNVAEYGHEMLQKHNNDINIVSKMPRAVDSIRVKLQKRATTAEEKEFYKQFMKG